MTHQVRRLSLTYAELELHEQYVISTIKEDQVLDKEQIEEMREIFYDHFGDRKWVYVSNRKNKYNVNPVIYIDLIQRKSLIGIAIVRRESDGALTANFEKQFATIPFEMFDNKAEALAWANGMLSQNSKF